MNLGKCSNKMFCRTPANSRFLYLRLNTPHNVPTQNVYQNQVEITVSSKIIPKHQILKRSYPLKITFFDAEKFIELNLVSRTILRYLCILVKQTRSPLKFTAGGVDITFFPPNTLSYFLILAYLFSIGLLILAYFIFHWPCLRIADITNLVQQ